MRSRVNLLGLLLLSVTVPHDAGAVVVPFGTRTTIASSAGGTSSVSASDVDGDGDLDLLVATTTDSTIAWHENTAGTGSTWTRRTIATTASNPRSVFGADVDGDGDQDVLAATANDDRVTWYENTSGNGSTWAAHVVSTVGDGSHLVRAADLDRDGDLDVVSASLADDTVAWHENTAGDGSAWTRRVISTLADGATAIATADVDQDGDPDVLSSNFLGFGDQVVWYDNTAGDGSAWTRRVVSATADDAQSIDVMDLDGDGDPDVVSATFADDTIAWYENTAGNGSAWVEHVVSALAGGAMWADAIDLDGDGDGDLVSASFDDNEVAWHENTNGTGLSWTEHVIHSATAGGFYVVAEDLDRDGDGDVVSLTDQIVGWYRNETIHGSAAFPFQAEVSATVPAIQAIAAADLDHDGDEDLLSACAFDGKIAWHENSAGDGSVWDEHEISTQLTDATSVASADLDGDGDLDVLSCDYSDGVAWRENTSGDGSTWTEHVVSSTLVGTFAASAADIDADGYADVVTASAEDDTVAWHENTSGDGSTWVQRAISTTADGAVSASAVDVDGDGDLDVVSAAFDANSVAWYENMAGNGSTWVEHVVTSTAEGVISTHAVDVDRDDDLDVLVASFYEDLLSWYENLGEGFAWSEHVIDSAAPGVFSVTAADLDQDGDPDVLSAFSFYGTVAWYENTAGNGASWTEHVVSTTADGANAAQVVDANGDGAPDIVWTTPKNESILWQVNRGGQFALITEDTAPATMADGERDDLLRVTAVHNGRPGDPDMELATLALLLEESPGDPLSTSEANALFDNLFVFRDEGSGQFENGADTLVVTMATLSLVAGRQTIPLPDGATSARIVAGAAATYFIVVDLAHNASSLPTASFRAIHAPASGSTAEDRSRDIPLTLEYAPDVPSGLVAVSVGAGAVPDGRFTPGGQLVMSKQPGGAVRLSWSASCKVTDTDYEIYEGTIGGTFTSHVPVLCSTSGATTATITPSAGPRYYLVVPRNAIREGSHGKNSGGNERPRGSGATCLPQAVGTCP